MHGMEETTREGRLVGAIPEDTYARRLMLARHHAGQLSIRDAAEKCGLNYRTWADWESGSQSRTKVEDAQIIAETLGVDRDWLLHGGPLTVPERRRRAAATQRKTYASARPGERYSRAHRRPRPRRRVAA
jgi:transcriptional regulator with XRE-family HTH domain